MGKEKSFPQHTLRQIWWGLSVGTIECDLFLFRPTISLQKWLKIATKEKKSIITKYELSFTFYDIVTEKPSSSDARILIAEIFNYLSYERYQNFVKCTLITHLKRTNSALYMVLKYTTNLWVGLWRIFVNILTVTRKRSTRISNLST